MIRGIFEKNIATIVIYNYIRFFEPSILSKDINQMIWHIFSIYYN